MTTTDETVDKPLELAHIRVLDAHHWGTGAVVEHLDAMKFFALPALELCDPDWMAMAKGATALALVAVQDTDRHLTDAAEALEAAAVYAKRYES